MIVKEKIGTNNEVNVNYCILSKNIEIIGLYFSPSSKCTENIWKPSEYDNN